MVESSNPDVTDQSLPPSLTLRGVSRTGPLPFNGRWSTAIHTAQVAIPALVRDADAPLPEISTTPLRTQDGTDAGATLDCRLEPSPPRLLTAVVGNLAPGVYSAEVRLQTGDSVTRLPVEVRVAAWWPWLLACILLGLLSLGAAAFLAEQAALAERRTQVLGLQDELSNLWQRNGGVASVPSQAATDALQGALEVLAQPRPNALKDGRIPRADALIAQARTAITALTPAPSESAPGAAAVQRLVNDWSGAKERIAAIRTELQALASESGAAGAPGTADHTLDATLSALDRGLVEAMILPLADAIERELGIEVERVRATAQSGAGDRAGQLARRTSQRIAVTLGALLERTDLTLALRNLSQEARGRVRLLRESIAAAHTPAQLRQTLNTAIDRAIKDLAERPTLGGLQTFHGTILRIDLELLKQFATTVVASTQAAKAQMEQETDIAPIEAAIARLGPGDSQAAKQRHLHEIAGLWQERIAGFSGPRQAAMKAAADDLERHITTWNPDGLASAMKTLMAEWTAYSEERFTALKAAPMRAFCSGQAAATALSLSANASALALSAPDPTLAGLDAELDALAFRLAQLPQDATCLEVLIDLDGRSNRIGNQIFEAATLRSRLPPDLRLDAARRTGEAQIIALMERLLREPRPLTLHPRSAQRDWVQDRDLVYEVQGLDPAWGQAVRVQVDFGDGHRIEMDAFSLGQAGVLSHRYTNPGTYGIQIRADLVAGTEAAAAPPLGHGDTQVQIAPSPINRTRALADNLISLRTGLALVIALLVHGWRLAGRAPFGASGQDYLEAFAIGASGQATVDGIIVLLKGGT